jgi:hypothetical protein
MKAWFNATFTFELTLDDPEWTFPKVVQSTVIKTKHAVVLMFLKISTCHLARWWRQVLQASQHAKWDYRFKMATFCYASMSIYNSATVQDIIMEIYGNVRLWHRKCASKVKYKILKFKIVPGLCWLSKWLWGSCYFCNTMTNLWPILIFLTLMDRG